MLEFFRRLFASDFMPHGHCFFWRPELVWLHVVSDGLIAAAYYSIPLALFYLARAKLSQMRGLAVMFGAFILACGTTHLISIWDLWHSAYRLEGVVKGITAALSVMTAIVTARLIPVAMKMPTHEALETANVSLLQENRARQDAERKLRGLMESERLLSENKIRSFSEGAWQEIIAIQKDGPIVLVNRRTEEMFGYDRAELLGQKLSILLPERARSAHNRHLLQFFNDPRTRPMGIGLE